MPLPMTDGWIDIPWPKPVSVWEKARDDGGSAYTCAWLYQHPSGLWLWRTNATCGFRVGAAHTREEAQHAAEQVLRERGLLLSMGEGSDDVPGT
jgi:hypothetical protein